MEKEIRTVKNRIQRDINNNSRIVQGYAVVFNTLSENMGQSIREHIERLFEEFQNKNSCGHI